MINSWLFYVLYRLGKAILNLTASNLMAITMMPEVKKIILSSTGKFLKAK